MSWIHALCAPEDQAGELEGTLVLVAHPDDETVGAGSRLHRLCAARFAYLTDGAPLEGSDAARHGLDVAGYRGLRRRERADALGRCGIAPSQVVELGCRDQEGALHLAAMARRVAGLLATHRVRTVLTHPYEGGHPDHDAAAFVVHAAAAMLGAGGGRAPALVEMASYHNGPAGPEAGTFLAHPQADAQQVTLVLDKDARRRKRELLGCYASQAQTLQGVPLDAERYRPAPRHDFRQPPHAGTLLYEMHPWGMSGARFRDLAVAALAELKLESAL